ncbi:hypothetical protein ACQ4LE_002777 [Meloidogyne hapla]|uniref:Biogenesis of lysosome-related organelles complex 1 subunit 5 n=1 Tax=Meloidogyne hapla TaxID=6305 RepID=A0A1I8BJ10_MELHA
MEIFSTLVENVQSISENMFSGINIIQPKEEQRIASLVSNIYKQINNREDIQNLLTKYQLQLFQIKEVNSETIRHANICSTRMGRVQQTLSEYSEQMDKLEKLFKNNYLNDWNIKLIKIGKEVNEIEKQILQTELIILELERIKEKELNKREEENEEDLLKLNI